MGRNKTEIAVFIRNIKKQDYCELDILQNQIIFYGYPYRLHGNYRPGGVGIKVTWRTSKRRGLQDTTKLAGKNSEGNKFNLSTSNKSSKFIRSGGCDRTSTWYDNWSKMDPELSSGREPWLFRGSFPKFIQAVDE